MPDLSPGTVMWDPTVSLLSRSRCGSTVGDPRITVGDDAVVRARGQEGPDNGEIC